MFLTIALVSAALQPTGNFATRYRCGVEDVRLMPRRGGGFLRVGRAQYVLRHARSASGARYVGNDGLEFWVKGDAATLTIGKRTPVECEAVMPGWAVESIGGRTVIAPPQITFAIEGDRISGYAGCNRFSGAFERREVVVRVGPLMSTKMACAPALMAQEARFLKALEDATSVSMTRDGAMIVSSTGGQRIVARKN